MHIITHNGDNTKGRNYTGLLSHIHLPHSGQIIPRKEVYKMENYAIKNGLKYFCHTLQHSNGFIIENAADKNISYGDFLCNRNLYHATIKDCLQHLSGTTQPIYYNGEDINPVRDCEDIFLHYNPYTGECYRPIDWKKYYQIIDHMEA